MDNLVNWQINNKTCPERNKMFPLFKTLIPVPGGRCGLLGLDDKKIENSKGIKIKLNGIPGGGVSDQHLRKMIHIIPQHRDTIFFLKKLK